MKLDELKDVKASEFTLFASLPDMGRVGGLVSSFLSQHLKMEQVAEITSSDKPWVSYADGVAKTASDVYKISYDRRHKLMVFTGESQPQDPGELYRLCNMLLAYTARRGGKKVRVGRSMVKPSTFKISDRGKPGRGQRLSHLLREALWVDPVSLIARQVNKNK